MTKNVLITGASRGIGASCAELFAKFGYKVAINYFKSREKALSLADKIIKNGGLAETFCADISDPNQVDDMYVKIKQKFGHPSVLINNAGISEQKLFSDITLSDWDNMFNVNIRGMFICCKKFLPYMIGQKYGRIINISSVWGISGGSCEVHYSSSKAAVIGFSKALAQETALSGVTVNCIAPGVIKTDMMAGYDEQTINMLKEAIPCGEIGSADDVAHAALFLASEKSSYITSQVINVGGGFKI